MRVAGGPEEAPRERYRAFAIEWARDREIGAGRGVTHMVHARSAVSIVVISLLSAVAHGAEAAPSSAITVETVRKAIVGVWNGTEEPCKGSVISLDAEGRITLNGVAGSQTALLIDPSYEQGKVKYRLEENKGGAGVVISEIGANGAENPIYIIEAIDDGTARMRAIDYQTRKPSAPVLWKHMSTEPYAIKQADLRDAAGNGDIGEVKRLLEQGAAIDAKSGPSAETALIVAAGNGHVEIVKLLLEKGADVKARGEHGRTVLVYAARGGRDSQIQAEIVKLLVARNVDVDARTTEGHTALMGAAWQNRSEVVTLLLGKGADVNAKGDGGWTALAAATQRGHAGMAALLKAAGARE